MKNETIQFHLSNESLFLTLDEKENFEERAAIMEYEAGLSKLEAEERAIRCIINKRKKFQNVV